MPEPLPAAESIASAAGAGHRRVLWSTGVLSAAAIVVKLASLAKDFYIARQLGTGNELDAYLVALLLPSYAVVVLSHAVSSAFVPAYVRVWHERGQDAAQRLAGGVLVTIVGTLLAVTALLFVVTPLVLPVIGLGFSDSKLELTRRLFYPMAGILLASGLSAVFAAVLEAHERFAAKAIAPLTVPLGTLAVYFLFQGQFGVEALAVGTLAGYVAEAAILGLAVWLHGWFPVPQWGDRRDLSRFRAQYWPIAVAGLFISSSLVVDQGMAASLGSGQVSVLSYGSKVVSVLVSSVAVSMGTVLLPRFSHLIASGRWHEFKRTFTLYAGGIFLVAIPGVAVLIFLSEPLVRLLFERGAFGPESTLAVARVQQWLLPQLPFYIVVLLGSRVLSAMDGNRAVLAIGAVNLATNVVGNLVLMRWYGVNGIAMATSLVYMLGTILTLIAIRRKIAETERR